MAVALSIPVLSLVTYSIRPNGRPEALGLAIAKKPLILYAERRIELSAAVLSAVAKFTTIVASFWS
jgi:hypothetical protein